MQTVVIAVLVTLLLALAVKQLSFALMQGSLFDPLRRYIRDAMRREVFGFEILSELISCKLCMTMQVSLWFVMIPALVAGMYTNAPSIWLGAGTATGLSVGFLIWGCFVYATGVSGIALGLWVFLEYPAKRYEDVAFQLAEAQRTIEDLQAIVGVEEETGSTEMGTKAHEHA